MLKKVIIYTDFNDEERTEEFYFNLSKTELVEMETSVDGGFGEMLKRIAASGDVKNLFAEFKKIILMSYGEKSPDGKRFFKSDEIAQSFVASPAFDSLFMSIATDADMAAAFVKGIIPQDLVGQFDASMKQTVLPAVAEVPTPVETT